MQLTDLEELVDLRSDKCLAQKVNSNFSSTEQFLNAILADTTASAQIAQLQQACASELFNWVVEVDEVIISE